MKSINEYITEYIKAIDMNKLFNKLKEDIYDKFAYIVFRKTDGRYDEKLASCDINYYLVESNNGEIVIGGKRYKLPQEIFKIHTESTREALQTLFQIALYDMVKNLDIERNRLPSVNSKFKIGFYKALHDFVNEKIKVSNKDYKNKEDFFSHLIYTDIIIAYITMVDELKKEIYQKNITK